MGRFVGLFVFFEKALDNFCRRLYNNKASQRWLAFMGDLSSAGRASALQAEGHRFEPYRPHIYRYGGIAQLARAHGSYPWCREFKSPFRY